MSCQQASRLITTTTTTNIIAAPKTTTTTTLKASTNNASLTKGNVVTVTSKEDPYVFTDTVSSTPPILFNTQKSRVRANEAQHKNNCYIKQAAATAAAAAAASTTTTAAAAAAAARVTANTKASIVSTKATPFALLNGDSTAANGVAVGAALKAQASLPIAATIATQQQQQQQQQQQHRQTTTNFNNVTQSHKQQQQQQHQQHKRATNICIVRPQLQQQQQQQQQHQLLQQQKQKLQKHTVAVPAATSAPQPPPPLYTHTPSLWQTPLLLDTTVVTTPTTAAVAMGAATTPTQQQQQQKPLMLPIAAAAITPPLSVSPPTSPASLPSPNASATPAQPLLTYTAVAQGAAAAASIPTATAMVAPIIASSAAMPSSVVVVAGQPLPPSKFHHTTLAQHLQKVECLKKPKRALPLASVNTMNSNNINNNIYIETPKPALKLLTQPPPLKAFDTISMASTVLQQAKKQQQQHSAEDDTDLSEIPVNVIFRKPVANEMSCAATEHTAIVAVHVDNPPKNMRIIPNNMVMTTVSPLTPPTPPTPPTLSKLFAQAQPLPPHQQQQQQHQLQSLPPPPALVTSQQGTTLAPKCLTQKLQQLAKQQQHQPQSQGQKQQLQQLQPLQLQQQQPQHMSSIAATTKRKTQAGGSKNNTNKKTPTNNTKKNALNVVGVAELMKTAATKAAIIVNSNAGQVGLQQHDNLAPTVSQQQQPQSTVVTVPANQNDNISNNTNSSCISATTTVSTVSSYLSDPIVERPYCVQQHWLQAGELTLATSKSSTNDREERIAEHKSLLRRKALQLLATHSLQKLPLTLARQRLQSVDRMLHRAQQQRNKELYDIPAKKCLFPNCTSPTVTMSAHCLRHIVNNTSQQIFAPCIAKFSNGQPCRVPVFDLFHDLALCVEHKRLRNEYEQQRKPPATVAVRTVTVSQQQPQQTPQQQQMQQQRLPVTTTAILPAQVLLTAATTANKVQTPHNQAHGLTHLNGVRKRKHNIGINMTNPVNPVGRPQKRNKKQLQPAAVNTEFAAAAAAATNATASGALLTPATLPTMSVVLQRKSSTTSLESIASNSQSSCSQAQYAMASIPNQSSGATTTITAAPIVSMPALAPLSNTHNAMLPSSLPLVKNDGKMIGGNADVNNSSPGNFGNLNMMINANYKVDDINQISAQLIATGTYNNNNNNNNANNNNNNNNHYNNNMNFNGNFLNGFSTNSIGCNNNMLANSTDELLTHDMFSICENSSAYASSEDTGLGGLSESELIGSHDADDIPLGDTRLLEEHDLANVFSTLPVDAFNELFTSVRQDECDEMDRQLELADKDIKCLQQSIGSDSDFLGDFLDVNDDILADTAADICRKMDIVSSVINSPDTSGIDAATLFADSNGCGGGGSNSGGGGEFHVAGSCPTVADIRGLVQT